MDYFLYSSQQVKEKNEIADKMGKKFVCGQVVVNGVRKKFSQISGSPTMTRYIDTQVVTSGDRNKLTYTDPVMERR